MPNLYQLMDQYEALQGLLEEEGSSPEQVSALLDQIDEAQGALSGKVDAICRVLKNLEAQAGALESEEKRLAARRKARESSIKDLRQWVKVSMTVLDVKQIKTDLFTVQLTEGKPSVLITDEKAVPDEYVKVKREPDKTAIMKAFKSDGLVVPGTDILRSTTLRIL
jgi:DNA repair ATPase RecN